MSQITKKALEDALRHFLAQKPLNKITISDLTDYCGVSRMTFYYHFEDIYDLMLWAGQESIRQNLNLDDLQADWKEGLLRVFQVAQSDRVVILNVYRAMGRAKVEESLEPYLHQIIARFVDSEAEPYDVTQEDKAFVTRCFCYLFMGVTLDWVQDGMKEEPDHIVSQLDFLHGSAALALSQISQKRTS